ncbi:MAG: 50S ribosomal protein L30 [Burkholderiales bacterium]
MVGNRIKIKLVKSPIGAVRAHRASVRGLGFKRMNQSVTLEDTPAVRGMIHRVRHLVRIED